MCISNILPTLLKRGFLHLFMAVIHYNPDLKKLASKLRNQSTQSEIRLWEELKGRKLNGYRFIRQKPIGDYIVDFFCKEAGLVIELDGVSHHFEATMEKDIRKQSYLESIGLKVLHFDDEEVMTDMPNVLRVIEHALS